MGVNLFCLHCMQGMWCNKINHSHYNQQKRVIRCKKIFKLVVQIALLIIIQVMQFCIASLQHSCNIKFVSTNFFSSSFIYSTQQQAEQYNKIILLLFKLSTLQVTQCDLTACMPAVQEALWIIMKACIFFYNTSKQCNARTRTAPVIINKTTLQVCNAMQQTLAVYNGKDLVFLHCITNLIDYSGKDLVWSRHSLGVQTRYLAASFRASTSHAGVVLFCCVCCHDTHMLGLIRFAVYSIFAFAFALNPFVFFHCGVWVRR